MTNAYGDAGEGSVGHVSGPLGEAAAIFLAASDPFVTSESGGGQVHREATRAKLQRKLKQVSPLAVASLRTSVEMTERGGRLKPLFFQRFALRGAEAPLFHGGADGSGRCGWAVKVKGYGKSKSKATSKSKSKATSKSKSKATSKSKSKATDRSVRPTGAVSHEP